MMQAIAVCCMLAASASALRAPQTQQACDSNTATNAYNLNESYTTTQWYTSALDACRAAVQGLRDKMMGAVGVDCAPCPNPLECYGQILCNTGSCTELTVGPASEIPVGSGKWYCTATYNGDFGIRCSVCNP